jgi:hypothetical protein
MAAVGVQTCDHLVRASRGVKICACVDSHDEGPASVWQRVQEVHEAYQEAEEAKDLGHRHPGQQRRGGRGIWNSVRLRSEIIFLTVAIKADLNLAVVYTNQVKNTRMAS